MSKLVAVVDIDTTIANNDHRAALLAKRCILCMGPVGTGHNVPCGACGSLDHKITQASWDTFLRPDLMALDTPVPEAQAALQRMRRSGMPVHFVTGRGEAARQVTEQWLTNHVEWNPNHESLIMRSLEFEGLSASVYKEVAFKKLVEEQQLQGCQFLFFEDDPHVFNVYSRFGLVVKCPEGWSHIHPEGARGAEAARRR